MCPQKAINTKQPFTFQAELPIFSKKMKRLCEESPITFDFDTGDKYAGVMFDTFDGKLWEKGLLLLREKERLLLFDFTCTTPAENELQIEGNSNAVPFFAKDTIGKLGEKLMNVSPLRAFLPFGDVVFRIDSGRLLDDEEKTLVRLFEICLVSKKNDKKRIVLGATEYLRGYDKEHKLTIEILKKCGAIPIRVNESAPALSLGFQKKRYCSKPAIILHPGDSAKKSAATLIEVYLGIARENEKGIIADIDTEFLHDYRVSLRKIRSVIALFTNVFDKEEVHNLKKEFEGLMKPTNALRDLDVYLMQKEFYLSLIPANMHSALEKLFILFVKRREESLEHVLETLASREYKSQIKKLSKRFSASGKAIASGKNAERDVFSFACMVILKRYNQVCRIARGIDSTTPDEEVHHLRIVCKKLRYLLEFFAPLFPEKEIGELVRRIKKLQDTLGKFNDLSVQQEFLHRMIETDVEIFGEEKIVVAEAAGALAAMLCSLQKKERARVEKKFKLFDSERTRTSFETLFAKE